MLRLDPWHLRVFPGSVLLGAGVRTVIAPTWPVLDSAATTALMVALHRNLLDGMAANQALAAAIRQSAQAYKNRSRRRNITPSAVSMMTIK